MKPTTDNAAMSRDGDSALTPALMRDRDAARYVGMSTRQLWKMAATGEAPAPIKLSAGRMTRWTRASLDAWIEQLAATR